MTTRPSGSLQRLFATEGRPLVGERVVFLDDYDLATGARLVRGCDVWLNLPRPPLEASGTSGMKSAFNGGLQLSVLDGWWAEAYDGGNGWALPGEVDDDPDVQDAATPSSSPAARATRWYPRSTSATTAACRTAGSP